jgi:hypothetical protein
VTESAPEKLLFDVAVNEKVRALFGSSGICSLGNLRLRFELGCHRARHATRSRSQLRVWQMQMVWQVDSRPVRGTVGM